MEEITQLKEEQMSFLKLIPEPEHSSEGLPSFDSDQESDGFVPSGHWWNLDLKTYEDQDKPVVFFVCRGNTCRTAMAVPIARAYVEKHKLPFHIDSFGVAACTGMKPYPEAFQACEQLGLDISGHRSCDISDLVKYNKPIKQAFAFICMETWHQEDVLNYLDSWVWGEVKESSPKVFTLTDDGRVPDPIGDGARAYRKMLAFLKPLVEKKLRRMNNLYVNEQTKKNKKIAQQQLQMEDILHTS